MTGKELRAAINSLPSDRRIWLELTYNGRIWHQRWRREDARQLAAELSRVEKVCKITKECTCEASIDDFGDLCIVWQLT